jgi:hypothetical protein
VLAAGQGRLRASPLNLASLTNAHHQHDKAIILDLGNDSKVANAIASKPLAITRQRVAETPRIGATDYPLAQVSQNAALAVGAEPRKSRTAAMKLDLPGWRGRHRLVRFLSCRSRLSSVTRGPLRASRRRAR